MKRTQLTELAGVLGAVTGLLILSVALPSGQLSSLLPPIAFLYVPLAALLWKKQDVSRYGLRAPRLDPRTVVILVAVCAATLLPFVWGFGFWQRRVLDRTADFGRLPAWWAIGRNFVFQALIVAVPEEFFFRGYLQTRLWEWSRPRAEHRTDPRNSVKGYDLSTILSLLAASALFAMSHLIGSFHISRLLTFFPGLVFGFLWWKTRELWTAVIYHAVCNTLLWVLTAIYVQA